MVRQYPCSKCSVNVTCKQRALQCTLCNQWAHTKCEFISNALYDDVTHHFIDWQCTKCLFTHLPSIDKSCDNTVNLPCEDDIVKDKSSCDNFCSVQYDCFKSKGIKLAHLNIRSLYRNLEEIKSFLHNNQVHILALNETFLDDSVFHSELDIDDFHLVRKDRNRHGGGVAVYIHSSLSFDLIKYDTLFSSLEIIPVMIQPKCSTPLIFLTWYRPPNSNIETLQYYEEMLSFLDSFNYPIIVMSDTNCDLLNVPLSANSKRLNEIHNVYSLEQINTEIPTRITSDSSTLIDHTLTNKKEKVFSHGVIHLGISDHSLSYIIWKSKHSGNPQTVNFRKKSGIDLNSYFESLKNQPWFEVLDIDDIDLAISKWESLFMNVVNRYMPVKKKRMKIRKSPWMNSDIFNLIKKRNKLKEKAWKAKDEQKMKDYRKLRNKVTFDIRKAKKKYYTDQLTKIQTNAGNTWSVLKSLLPSNNSMKSTFSNEEHLHQRSEQFNDYFANVGKVLASKIPEASDSVIFDDHTDSCFNFQMITVEEVQKEIKLMKNKSACGTDGISIGLLKMSAPIIAPYLTYLFNKSLLDSKFPNQYKTAKVIPIFKSGNKEDPCNYRPISILPTVSKILEKLVCKQLKLYMNEHEILSRQQSGFRKMHSTMTSLLKVTDEWLESMDKGLYTGAVFIDLKKAFDTVDVNILLNKLESLGVTDNVLHWFRTYLCNRQIFTCLNSTSSNILDVDYGIPQGSTLGPLLFTIYINDLVNRVKHCNIHLYADDTVLYFSDKNVCNIQRILNIDLNNVHNWLCQNKLSLNVEKTISMLFGSSYMLSKYNIFNVQISGKAITQKNVFKYLGMQLDPRLKWDIHIDEMCKKIGKTVNYLARLRHCLPQTQLKLVYNSIILPLFDYADIVYDSASKKHVDRLQKLQNRAGRIILSVNPYDHISNNEIHGRLGWSLLQSRRKSHLLTMVYKSLHSLAPSYLKDRFNYNNYLYGLRSRGNLALPKPKSESCRRMFLYRGSREFNRLPNNIKLSNSLSVFCKELSAIH